MNSNLVRLPTAINQTTELLIIKPRDLAEVPPCIQALQRSQAVVLNLTLMTPEQAQQSVDFLVGGAYALEGDFYLLNQQALLLTPRNILSSILIKDDVVDWSFD
ncbi:MAG: cell division protein SepF [Chroococcidiopsidaceae cyanobacterium CP_BM_ER_R8_30]|nr:cell division protein SepF [Chroococcidiopsidaceae cyanobacterium CP_BM_ER_R8_30]